MNPLRGRERAEKVSRTSGGDRVGGLKGSGCPLHWQLFCSDLVSTGSSSRSPRICVQPANLVYVVPPLHSVMPEANGTQEFTCLLCIAVMDQSV